MHCMISSRSEMRAHNIAFATIFRPRRHSWSKMMLNARQRIKQRVHDRAARGDAAIADPASVIFGVGCVDGSALDKIGDGS